jgi:hypothetical protein
MKRWYVFFLLVAILTALASLGIFSGSVEQQTAGQAGPGKLLFLTLLGVGGVAYAGWLAYSSSRRRKLGSGNADGNRISEPEPPPASPEQDRASWPRSERGDNPVHPR